MISMNNSWSAACLQSVGPEHIDTWYSGCFGWMQRMFPEWVCLTYRVLFSPPVQCFSVTSLHLTSHKYCALLNLGDSWWEFLATKVAGLCTHKKWMQEDLQVQVRPNFCPHLNEYFQDSCRSYKVGLQLWRHSAPNWFHRRFTTHVREW